MSDSDVAILYGYKTKALNLAVRRDIERFPVEFCFKINGEEADFLRFQFETSKNLITIVICKILLIQIKDVI